MPKLLIKFYHRSVYIGENILHRIPVQSMTLDFHWRVLLIPYG